MQSKAVNKIVMRSKEGKIHLLNPSPRNFILTNGPMTSKKAHFFTFDNSRKLYATAIASLIRSIPEKTKQGGSVCYFEWRA